MIGVPVPPTQFFAGTGLCCITAPRDSLSESGSIGGRDGETRFPEIPHDELERV
jgi:hypothetical protein